MNCAQFKLFARSNFEAVFFCPASCRRASSQLRPFFAINKTYTRLKYQMQLLIACGINANNNSVPLAWALVLIKDEYQQTQFFEQLYIALLNTQREGVVFISDREKGIVLALEKVYLLAFHAYCCQHIADNVQTKFGNACQPLFQACTRAKSKATFQSALKTLFKQDSEARKYVNAILYKY